MTQPGAISQWGQVGPSREGVISIRLQCSPGVWGQEISPWMLYLDTSFFIKKLSDRTVRRGCLCHLLPNWSEAVSGGTVLEYIRLGSG